MSHRRRKRKSRAEEKAIAIEQNREKGNGFSLTDLLKKTNFRDLSGQLKNVADSMEKIGELVVLMEQVDVLVKPKSGGLGGSPLNIMKMLQNSGSLNHLLQAILPALRDSGSEKKVNPITVETSPLDNNPDD